MSGLRRTFAVARKVARTLRHDRRSLALMLVAPVLAMAVFGLVFGAEIRDVPVAVVDLDRGAFAAEVVSHLDPDVVVLHVYEDPAAARRAVSRGEVRAALVFPEDFSEGVSPQPSGPPAGATLRVVIDGSDAQSAAAVERAVQRALVDAFAARGLASPVSVDRSFVHSDQPRVVDTLVPGIVAFAAMLFTTLLTLLAFVGERSEGTLSRLLVTPIRPVEIVTGYALAFGVVAVLQGVVLLAAAVLLFDALLLGPVLVACGIVALLGLSAMSLGIVLSAAARREGQAVQMLPLVIFPTFLLSGIFVPVTSLPEWLRPLSWVIPPTWAVDALRQVMLRGRGIEVVWVHALALAAFSALFLALAVLGVARQRARPGRGQAGATPRSGSGKSR